MDYGIFKERTAVIARDSSFLYLQKKKKKSFYILTSLLYILGCQFLITCMTGSLSMCESCPFPCMSLKATTA